MGHAVHPAAQQALLDDSHRLHRGGWQLEGAGVWPGHAELPSPQVTVVTKYLFQFGFFPWNSHTVLRRYENKPYFPPRILGLEKSDGYIKYDLVQLMALFFHRSQLLVSRVPGRPAGRLPSTHSPSHLAPGGRVGCRGRRVGLAVLQCLRAPP